MKKIIKLIFILSVICLTSCQREVSNMKIMSYNVGSFNKYLDNSDAMIAAMVKESGAEIMVLNELDSNNERHNYDQLSHFAELMDWDCKFAKAIDYKGGAYGIGIAYDKKFKPLDSFEIAFPKTDGSEDRVCLVIEFKDFVIAGTHLDHMSVTDRLSSVEKVTSELKEKYGMSNKLILLCGDMNATPESETLVAYRNDWNILTPEDPTIPSENPVKCIDYIMNLKYGAPCKVLSAKVMNHFENGKVELASDHLPVFAEIEF